MDVILPESAIVYFLCNFPPTFVWAAFLCRMLDAKRPSIQYLATVSLAICDFYTQCLSSSDTLQTVITVVGTIVCYFVLPAVLSRKPPAYTLLAILAAMAVLYGTGLSLGLCLNVLVGQHLDWDLFLAHPDIAVIFKTVQLSALALSLWGLLVLFSRWDRRAEEAPRQSPWVVLVPLIQAAALVSIPLLPAWSNNSVAWLLLVGTLMLSVCDVLFFASYNAWVAEESARAHADALSEEIATQYATERRILEQAESLSKLRHDFANQTQAIRRACCAGDTDEARDNLTTLRVLLERES